METNNTSKNLLGKAPVKRSGGKKFLPKFTFKTENPTGRYRSFFSSYHYIKLLKKQVGTIGDKKPHNIRLMVIKEDINEDGNPNCKWKWITLKKESENLDEAKTFLNTHIEALLSKYNLHLMEND